MERVEELCCYYVALLRSIYLIHQNSHWITSGQSFYGDHLLFERIYKSAAEDADLAAEKFIGLFGSEVIDLHMQAQLIGETLKEFSNDSPHRCSLNVEKKFLTFSEKFYRILKDEGDKMSLGLDDMLMQIASNREGAVYLLKQTNNETGDDMNSRMAARKAVLQKMAQTQTENALKLQKKINMDLSVNLGNRNWGVVGVNVSVLEADGGLTVNCNLTIPVKSPPFVDKKKYPQGLNQFKQEMMNVIRASIQAGGASPDNSALFVRVNGQ